MGRVSDEDKKKIRIYLPNSGLLQKIKNKIKNLRNFWMNCVLLGILARLYLNDMALEVSILLLSFVITVHSN